MNDQIAKAIASLPGYGVGQALKGAVVLPKMMKQQKQSDMEKQKAIQVALAEIDLLKKSGVKPSQERFKNIQGEYQTMANDQMQMGKDMESVRNAGLKSAGLSATALAAPTLLPKVIAAIEKSKLFLPEGGMIGKKYGQKATPWILNKILAR